MAGPTPCTTCYLTYDHLGSVRMVTDENANVVSRHDYLPFGEEIPSGTAGRSADFGDADSVSQRFTGQIRDGETGLDFFGARYYGSALGRFTSPDPYDIGADPSNPQSWNGYAYVLNDPCGLVDPYGLSPCSYNISLLPGKNSPYNNPDVATGIQNEIARIFGLADLGVNFTGTNPDYTLVVANSVPSGFKIDPNAIGFTMAENGSVLSRGTVYASRLEQFDPATAQNSAFLAIGLGRAGTHEIGHYLLQMQGHSPSGLMQAGFSGSAWHLPDRSGQFAFTAGQAAILQQNWQQRHPPAKGTATSTITYGPSGGSSGFNGGWVFQPMFGEEGNAIGGSWVWMPTPNRQTLLPY